MKETKRQKQNARSYKIRRRAAMRFLQAVSRLHWTDVRALAAAQLEQLWRQGCVIAAQCRRRV